MHQQLLAGTRGFIMTFMVNLPLLVVSEKQVKWAVEIRAQVLINVNRALKLSDGDIADHGENLPDAYFIELHELHMEKARKLMSNSDAKFWIESRVLALGSALEDSHPFSMDTAISILRDWDREDRAAIKALREKYL